MKAKITYAQLQERVAAAAGITKKEAQTLLKEVTAAVGDGLVTDGKVNLAGLGRFSRKVQSARRGRNPQTGQPIDIPQKNRVDFLPEAQWRRYVNRGYEQMRAVLPPPTYEPAVKTTDEPVAESTPATADTHQPKKKSLPLRPAGSDRPAEPIDTKTEFRAISPPAPQVVATGNIPPEEKTDRKRRARLVPAVGVILVLAAALFFLWPRSQPPGPARLEPIQIAARETVRPPETAPLEPTAVAPVTASGYTVAAGDSLWQIANTTYDYPYFWPVIFRENQADIQHPDALAVGVRLIIPTFAGRVGRLTESDFQELADGYLQVYRAYQRNDHPQAPYYLWVAYRLRAHWVPESELVIGAPEDLKFIRQLKGQGLIH